MFASTASWLRLFPMAFAAAGLLSPSRMMIFLPRQQLISCRFGSCACAAFRRIVSKFCDEIRILNCLSFFMFPLFLLKWVGCCPANSIWREPPGDQPNAMLAPPEWEDFSTAAGLFWVSNLRFPALPARRRNVGLCTTSCAHTRSLGKSRTQRRHAPHGVLRAFDTPAGSIGSIFSTVGRSAPSTLFRQIRRSPLLFRKIRKCRFSLEYQRFFGFDARNCSATSPRFRQGRSFQQRFRRGADFRLFCRSSERRFSI